MDFLGVHYDTIGMERRGTPDAGIWSNPEARNDQTLVVGTVYSLVERFE